MTFKSALAVFAAIVLPVFSFAAGPANIAVVNGKPISASRADFMAKTVANQGQQVTPELRAKIREELINREVLLQEAEKQGLGKNADVREELEITRQTILIRALLAEQMKKAPVSEAEMKSEYDKYKAQVNGKEYRARHILLEKEEDAKAIIAKLKSGAKFEDLAKQSKDPGSAGNGGNLDWASPASFVKPFADALVALKKGDLTNAPVRTQFGFHVIRLDDIRDAKAAPYEQLKPQIQQALQQKKMQGFQEQLRKKAVVQ